MGQRHVPARHLLADPAWGTATNREPPYRPDTPADRYSWRPESGLFGMKSVHESGASRRMSYTGYIAVSDHELRGRLFMSQASALLAPRERA
jgi:hypothetical protein